MVPIVEEMERRVKEEVGRVEVCFLSYMEDFHSWLYENRRAGDDVERQERMPELVLRMQRGVTEVAGEYGQPLDADQEE